MRDRAWRRAQRERVRTNRRKFLRTFWRSDGGQDYIEQRWRFWSKVNPLTQCSCPMCQYDQNVRKGPKPSDWGFE